MIDLISNKKIKITLSHLFAFILITLLIHYSYRHWANQLHFSPIEEEINSLRENIRLLVYRHSKYLINLLNPYTYIEGKYTFHFEKGYLAINLGCSGLKQILQASVLLFVYPGRIIHKLWYIPIAIVLMHSTNLLRIYILSWVVAINPQHFDIFHDIILRPLFYVVIFLLWYYWLEGINKKPSENNEAQ